MNQQSKNKEFAIMLARFFYNNPVKTLPIALNSEQYKFFKEEWNRLNETK